ncbi:MAG: hypothetical protein JW785_03495 [Acidimicrobiia bacterium]|nr:hypothetical protein [Acidimicrobiia bacterium]
MRLSLPIRRHRALVVAAAALTAGFLAAVPLLALAILACGAILAGLARLGRERPGIRCGRDAGLGGGGYLEAGSSPAGGRDGG